MDFERLTNEHKDSVYRQLIRVCGNREDAEDVLIDALVRAHSHLSQLRDSALFRAWLAKIASRVCWQLKQREKLLPLLQLSMLEDEGHDFEATEPSPEEQIAVRQMKALFRDAILQLPEDYREVYQLRDIEELSGDEVARRLSISVPAMKSRLHRAREMMRQQLDQALLRGTNS